MGAVTGLRLRWCVHWNLIGRPPTIEVIEPRAGDDGHAQWLRAQQLLLQRFEREARQSLIAGHILEITRFAPPNRSFTLEVCGYTASIFKT